MKLELYEKYKLKDGRIGWIVEILGKNEACVFEIDKEGTEDRLIQVLVDEIAEKLF